MLHRVEMEGGRRGELYHGTGKYPTPRNSWNRKTNAVAAYAQPSVPVDSSIAAITKQKQSPAADTMSAVRRPNLSMLHKGMIEPTRYTREVQPPRIRERLRERCIVLS